MNDHKVIWQSLHPKREIRVLKGNNPGSNAIINNSGEPPMSLKLLPLACAAGTLVFASQLHAQTTNQGNCGYNINSGVHATWPKPASYQGWSAVVNKTGEVATSFKILLDLGNTSIRNGNQADYSPTEGGYFVNSPS